MRVTSGLDPGARHRPSRTPVLHRGIARRRGRSVGGFALLLVLTPPLLAFGILAIVGGLPSPLPGLPDPGALTRLGLPLLRGLRDGTGALTVGLLTMAAWIVPPTTRDEGDRLGGTRRYALRLATACGAVWVTCGALMVFLTYSDLTGQPLATTLATSGLFVTGDSLGRLLAGSAALSGLAVVLAGRARRVATVAWAQMLALASLLPLAATGHTAGTANHNLAIDSQVVHVVGVSLWVGGLAAMLLLSRRLDGALEVVARRYSRLAGMAYLLVAVSGVAAAWARLESVTGLVSPYGTVLLLKVALFVLLGVAGWAHRHWLLSRLAGGPGRQWFVRLVAMEVTVMAAALGLASALSVMPPPADTTWRGRDATEALLGSPMPPPLTSGLHWLTQWQVDTVWVPVAALAIGWYTLAALRLRSRGDHWPVGRVIAWVAGWLTMIVATSASPGVYARVLFSAHMVQHMTVAMAVPVLLVFGAPVTLALRTLRPRRDGSRGPREWLLAVVHSRPLALLGHPLVAASVFIASLTTFYYTPLFDFALRTHGGHVLMTLHFLLSGYLLVSAVVGVDPGPTRPVYPFRMILLMVTFAFHALFAVTVMSSGTIFAVDWFGALDRPWGNSLAEEQILGGAVGWALGDYPVAIMAVALAISWIRSDAREARRYDRQAGRDGDAALARYNERLGRLRAHHEPSAAADVGSESVRDSTGRQIVGGDR